MLVLGRREAESGLLAVRRHGEGQIGTMTVADFRRLLLDQVAAATEG
jgi:threonyl-tRNA synthetase